jgi:hypothetical protein
VIENQPRLRFPLLGLGILALVAGMWSGLVRLGWSLSSLRPALPIAHGPLMVSGFLGAVVCLERAVALGRRWTYAGPVLTVLGALFLIAGITGPYAPALILLGSAGLVAVLILIIRLQPALFTVTMGLGALCWLVGNALWLSGWPIFRIALWWAGFLVLTIAGERVELSRIRQFSVTSRMIFVLITALYLVGLVGTTVNPDIGTRIAGAGMLALGVWLMIHDIAWFNLGQKGLPRFMAASLLSGFIWLGIGGLLAMLFGGVFAGPRYDALLHTVFLGFVFSMIFGHAPVIFPAVLGLKMTYRPLFYSHLILLHLTLLVRITGDLLLWMPGRMWGGLLNAFVLLLFLGNTISAMIAARR